MYDIQCAKKVGLQGRLEVLHIYRTYFPETKGGVQEAIRQICLSTKELGCNNTIYSLAKNCDPAVMHRPEGELVRERSVCEVASCDFGSPRAIFTMRRLAARSDIVHCHYPWPFGDILALLGSARRPFVVTYHSDIVRQRMLGEIYRPLRDRFLRKASAIVATSDAYRSSSPVLRGYIEKTETIPLPFDVKKMEPPRQEIISAWRNKLGSFFFLFVGVLRYYKGLHYLIEAARATGLPVVILGDGPERERLQTQAKGLANVHFLGGLDDADKFALMHLATALVFPSHLRAEAFGVSLLEASAMGRPMITTDIGTGTSLVNEHGETGIVVPPGDVGALSAAMMRLKENPQLGYSMGCAARSRCERLFSGEVVGRSYRSLYDRVLSK